MFSKFIFGSLLRPLFWLDEPGAGGTSSEQTPNAGANGGKTFTQDEVNAIVGRTRTEGREVGERALLEKLGVKSADDLTSIIQAARQAEEANKTELQRAQDAKAASDAALAEERQQREEERNAFTKRLLDGEIRIAASTAVMDKDGKKVIRPAFRKEALEDVTLLIDRKQITEKDGKFEGLDKALEELAKAKPYLLEEQETAPKGTPTLKGQKRTEPVGANEERRRNSSL